MLLNLKTFTPVAYPTIVSRGTAFRVYVIYADETRIV